MICVFWDNWRTAVIESRSRRNTSMTLQGVFNHNFSCIVASTILSSCLSGKQELLSSLRFSWSLSFSDSFSLSRNNWVCSCSTSSKTPSSTVVQYRCYCLCLLSFYFVLLRCASSSCALSVRYNTFCVAYPSASRSTTSSYVSASSVTWSSTDNPKLAPWSV